MVYLPCFNPTAAETAELGPFLTETSPLLSAVR